MRLAASIAALFALATLVTFLFEPDGYSIRIITLTLLYASLAQCWNLYSGLTNSLSLGHAAFFGIGAYTSTILLNRQSVSPLVGALTGMALAAVVALAIGGISLRLQGHYFALATLALAEVCRTIAITWSDVTGGPAGLSVRFLNPAITTLTFQTTRGYFYTFLAFFAALSVILHLIHSSRIGIQLKVLRQNEELAQALGINVTRLKLLILPLSAAFTALLGTLYAQFLYFIDPNSVFGFTAVSFRAVAITIVGGIGTTFGPLLGALLLIPAQELSVVTLGDRALGLAQLAYGVVLAVVILVIPGGLMSLFSRAGVNRLRRRIEIVRRSLSAPIRRPS